MSIMKTKKVSIYVISSQFNEIMEFLHKRGVMEFSGRTEGISGRYIKNIETELKKAEMALRIAEKYKPKKKKFSKRRRAALSDYTMERKETGAALEKVSEILSLEEKIKRNDKRLEDIRERKKELENYISLDLPLSLKATEHTETELGEIRCKNADELKIAKEGKGLHWEIIKSIGQRLFVWCVYLKEDKEFVNALLREHSFSPLKLATDNLLPKEENERILSLEKQIEKESDVFKGEIVRAAKSRRIIELYYDRLMLKRDKYKAAATAGNTQKTFVLTGYITEDISSQIASLIEKRFCAMVTVEDVEEDEILPVAFQNNALVSPVEEITASYSMPGKDDIDPNPLMAFFYYWFFGMMFSDAGYGLLMMAVCGILGFSGILEARKRGMLRMFFWCGVSTTVWGIAYGSFFGDLIGTVSKTFGSGKTEFAPVLIDPVNQALELLIISVAFGMVHILAALFVKFYKLWKKGDRQAAVYDVGFWIGVLVGISILALGMAIGNSAVKYTGIILAAVSGVGIVLTGGRDKKSFIMRFFSGILSLYDITGFVGDILSYSRLMALGLATGVIASVVNVLGSLGGNSPLGVVMFILISILGHSLNFAINMLGAYVHTNRLQYVEFYQKFYEGGGRRFRPLKMETKYFNFLE